MTMTDVDGLLILGFGLATILALVVLVAIVVRIDDIEQRIKKLENK